MIFLNKLAFAVCWELAMKPDSPIGSTENFVPDSACDNWCEILHLEPDSVPLLRKEVSNFARMTALPDGEGHARLQFLIRMPDSNLLSVAR